MPSSRQNLDLSQPRMIEENNNDIVIEIPYIDNIEIDDTSSFAKDLIKNYPKNLSWHEHIVKRGETLSEIANARGNITAQDIIRANGLSNTDNLRENQIILVPNFKQGVEDTLDEVHRRQMIEAISNDKLKPIRVRRYMVTAGDSLWSISRKFNVDVNTIKGRVITLYIL